MEDIIITYPESKDFTWLEYVRQNYDETIFFNVEMPQTKLLSNVTNDWAIISDGDFGLAVIGFDNLYKSAFDLLNEEINVIGWKDIFDYLKGFREFAISSGMSTQLWNKHYSNFKTLFG